MHFNVAPVRFGFNFDRMPHEIRLNSPLKKKYDKPVLCSLMQTSNEHLPPQRHAVIIVVREAPTIHYFQRAKIENVVDLIRYSVYASENINIEILNWKIYRGFVRFTMGICLEDSASSPCASSIMSVLAVEFSKITSE